MFELNGKKAFTLAESLFAIVIIGVVAVFVIPSINSSYKKNVLQAQFADTMKEVNKGFSNYLMLTNSYRKEEGNTESTTVLPSITDSNQAMISLFSENNPIEKISSQFRSQKIGTNCWENISVRNNFDGTGGTTNLNDLNCFIDGDNIIYALEVLSANCSTNLLRNNVFGNGGQGKHKLRNACGILYVDLNGTQSPNAFGKDVFAFVITNSPGNVLYPVGGTLMTQINSGKLTGISTWANTCSSGNREGRACAGRIVEEGMKIKYMK